MTDAPSMTIDERFMIHTHADENMPNQPEAISHIFWYADDGRLMETTAGMMPHNPHTLYEVLQPEREERPIVRICGRPMGEDDTPVECHQIRV